MRDYYAKNVERMREQKRAGMARRTPEQRARAAKKSAEWSAAHQDHVRLKNQEWRAANREADRASKKKWADANPEKVAAKREAWRKNNLARFNEAGKAWKKANPDAMKKYRLRKYGLTVEMYEAMLAEQGGRCAICDATSAGRSGAWCIDHCHETNEVRGLLCVKCNAGLGSFSDNPGHLLAAERYLQRSRRLKAVG